MGQFKRILIITTAEHACALYLASEIAKSDVEVLVVSQMAPKYLPSTWPYLHRLFKKRGACVFADNTLLALCERIRFTRLGQLMAAGPNSQALGHNWPVLDTGAWAARVPRS